MLPEFGLGPNPCKEWCVREIPLSQGYVTLVSGIDYLRINRYRWHVTQSKKALYAKGGLGKRAPKVYMHRFILQQEKEFHTDHLNRNGLHNYRSNIVVCDVSTNNKNRRSWKWGEGVW